MPEFITRLDTLKKEWKSRFRVPLHKKGNTKIWEESGTIFVQYHQTVIFEYDLETRKIRFSCGRWYTKATKDRINLCFRSFKIPLCISTMYGVWYLCVGIYDIRVNMDSVLSIDMKRKRINIRLDKKDRVIRSIPFD